VTNENERVRSLRKFLGLTLAQFGKRLGVQASAISKIERGENRVSTQMRLSICREFGVKEDWLRDGKQPAFVRKRGPANQADISFGKYAYDLSPIEESLIYAYLELPKDVRDKIIRMLSAVFTAECTAPSEDD